MRVIWLRKLFLQIIEDGGSATTSRGPHRDSLCAFPRISGCVNLTHPGNYIKVGPRFGIKALWRQNQGFLDKVLGRIGRLDKRLQSVVQRLASERTFLETLFNTIEDGVLVIDEQGRILYFNQAVTRLVGLNASDAEGRMVIEYLPELDWPTLFRVDNAGGRRVVRQEFEVNYPRPRFIRLYAAPLDEAQAARSRAHSPRRHRGAAKNLRSD